MQPTRNTLPCSARYKTLTRRTVGDDLLRQETHVNDCEQRMEIDNK